MEFDVHTTERLHDGHLKVDRLTLTHALIGGGTSDPIVREVVKRRQAVAVLLYAPASDRVVVVEQFRVGAVGHCHPWVLEPVAGLLEPGEDPIATVAREVEEETGLTASNFTPITTYFSSVGGSNEVTHLYAAEVDLAGWDCDRPRGLATEGEDIQPRVFSLPELQLHLAEQPICCASLVMAVQWLQLRLKR
jgi:ADP-ribose pyrophosphatase